MARYEMEFERRKDLGQGVRLSATLMALIAGAIFGLTSAAAPINEFAGAASLALLFCGAMFLVASVWYLALSHVGHEYSYVGFADEFQAIRERDRLSGTSWAQVDVSTEVSLITEYSACSSFNQRTNDLKSTYLHRANHKVVWPIFFVFAAGFVQACDRVAI